MLVQPSVRLSPRKVRVDSLHLGSPGPAFASGMQPVRRNMDQKRRSLTQQAGQKGDVEVEVPMIAQERSSKEVSTSESAQLLNGATHRRTKDRGAGFKIMSLDFSPELVAISMGMSLQHPFPFTISQSWLTG